MQVSPPTPPCMANLALQVNKIQYAASWSCSQAFAQIYESCWSGNKVRPSQESQSTVHNFTIAYNMKTKIE